MRLETKYAVLTISALASLWLLSAPATAQGYYYGYQAYPSPYAPPDYQSPQEDYYPPYPGQQPYEQAPRARRGTGYTYGEPEPAPPDSGADTSPAPRTIDVYNPPPDDAAAAASPKTGHVVQYETSEAPGTIVVDTVTRHLYYVEGGGRAIEYGIGVGREGFAWKGIAKVGNKQEWPKWFPPSDMLQRRPDLPTEMDGGLGNPLGARALYLFEGNKDTLFRIHGTNEPDTIGKAVSSGCIRMMNADVMDLYQRVAIGTKVVVL